MVGPVDRPPTLAAAAADKILEAIFQGELPLGAALREVRLAESLNTSRGTVRETLRQLQSRGLVEVIPHRGAFVTSLSPRRIKEIYTLRSVLEPYAVRLGLENKAYSQQALASLEALVQRLGRLEQGDEAFQALRMDMEFHHLICEPSDHQLLLEVLSRLQSQTILCFYTKGYRPGLAADEFSHQMILDTMKLGDPVRAEETVRDHISSALASLLGRLEGIC